MKDLFKCTQIKTSIPLMPKLILFLPYLVVCPVFLQTNSLGLPQTVMPGMITRELPVQCYLMMYFSTFSATSIVLFSKYQLSKKIKE